MFLELSWVEMKQTSKMLLDCLVVNLKWWKSHVLFVSSYPTPHSRIAYCLPCLLSYLPSPLVLHSSLPPSLPPHRLPVIHELYTHTHAPTHTHLCCCRQGHTPAGEGWSLQAVVSNISPCLHPRSYHWQCLHPSHNTTLKTSTENLINQKLSR